MSMNINKAIFVGVIAFNAFFGIIGAVQHNTMSLINFGVIGFMVYLWHRSNKRQQKFKADLKDLV